MNLEPKQYLKFCIIDAVMKNDDTTLEDLILKILMESKKSQEVIT